MTLLRSYMMETDLPMCVLNCLDVYLGLKKQKFVTNKQKIADFVSQHNIKATKSDLENKICYFLLVCDQFYLLESKINI